VRAFKQALNAEVVSWVDPQEIREEKLIWEETLIIEGIDFPILKALLVAQQRSARTLASDLDGVELVSLHSFWRWHAVWANRHLLRRGIPVWLVPHGGLDPYVFGQRTLYKRAFMMFWGRRFLDNVSAVVCATKKEYEKLERLVSGKPYLIAPWPLKDDEFRNKNQRNRERV